MNVELVWIYLYLCYQLVSSSGEISLRLVEYENPRGQGANGHCCDGRSIFCEIRGCDHVFTICFDVISGNDDIESCAYGRAKSGILKDEDHNTFGRSIAGLDNPISIRFRELTETGIRIKVKIEDDDSPVSGPDLVEYLYQRYAGEPDGPSDRLREIGLVFTGRTTLTTVLQLRCDEFYYGPHCAVMCQPRDNAYGHYNCDRRTGERVCHPGWRGQWCADSIDECRSSPCVNGRCQDAHLSFRCICEPGFTGPLCEDDINECAMTNICNNGTCMNTAGGYKCQCSVGYTGPRCNILVDYCKTTPCLNSGTCISYIGGFSCDCSDGFQGNFCEFPPMGSCSEQCNNTQLCLTVNHVSGCMEIDKLREVGIFIHKTEIFNSICNSYWNFTSFHYDSNQTIIETLESALSSAKINEIEPSQPEILFTCECKSCESDLYETFSKMFSWDDNDLKETIWNALESKINISDSMDYHKKEMLITDSTTNMSLACVCTVRNAVPTVIQPVCNITNKDGICACPNSPDKVCEVHSSRCEPESCLHDLGCFTVYAYKMAQFPVNESQPFFNETSQGNCFCMKLDNDRLAFCSVPITCPSDYCANGGTCKIKTQSVYQTTTLPAIESTAIDTALVSDMSMVATNESYKNTELRSDNELTMSRTGVTTLNNTVTRAPETSNINSDGLAITSVPTNIFQCLCTTMFTGDRCEINTPPIDPCSDINCLNQGTCIVRNRGDVPAYCACAEGYTGPRCETQIASSGNDDDRPQFTGIRSILLFKQKLTDEDISGIKRGMITLLLQQDIVSSNTNLKITHAIGICVTTANDSATLFIFDIKQNGKSIPYDKIEGLFNKVDAITLQSVFPVMPSHDIECREYRPVQAQQEPESWLKEYWYLVIFPGVVFITGSVFIAILYKRHRRRRQYVSHHGQGNAGASYNNRNYTGSQTSILDLEIRPGMETCPSTPETPQPAHPMCFKNETYDYVVFPPRPVASTDA